MNKNNFDLLRLVFSLLVVITHADIVGLYPIPYIEDIFNGLFAVQCFFVVSGFLVFQSWDRTNNWKKYFEKRTRRIYPAYVFAVLICAFFLVFVSTKSFDQYFVSVHFFKFVAANLTFLNFVELSLPGVFDAQPHSNNIVNAPLWTIKIEVMFYLSIPIIAWLMRYIRRSVLFVTIYVVALIWKFAFVYVAAETGSSLLYKISYQLPGQMGFFITGAALYYFFDQFRARAHWLFAIAIATLILHFSIGASVLFPAALAIAVIYLATIAPFCGNFGRYGDISYGVYIYHFPILQVVATLGIGTGNPYLTFLGCVLATLLVSFLSWHLIERPALYRSSHYVVATQTPGKVG